MTADAPPEEAPAEEAPGAALAPTTRDQKQIHALLRAKGIGDSAKHQVAAAALGLDGLVDSMTDLTRRDAARFIAWLEALPDAPAPRRRGGGSPEGGDGGAHRAAGAQHANVYEAIAAVMADLPAIGKGEEAAKEQGGYAYRGIEQITAHVQTLLAKHGLVILPKGEKIISVKEITVGRDKIWTDTTLQITFVAVHGPSRTRTRLGPFTAVGRDGSDKGPNKCRTQALKYALLQTFVIGDKREDADAGSPERDHHEPAPATMTPEEWSAQEAERLGYADGAAWKATHDRIARGLAEVEKGEPRDLLRDWMTEHGIPAGRRPAVPAAVAGELEELIRRALSAQVARAGGDEPPVSRPPDPTAPAAPSRISNPERVDRALAAQREVAAMRDGDVMEALRARGLPTTGSTNGLRMKLVTAIAEGPPPASVPEEAEVRPLTASLAAAAGPPPDAPAPAEEVMALLTRFQALKEDDRDLVEQECREAGVALPPWVGASLRDVRTVSVRLGLLEHPPEEEPEG